MIRRYSSSLSSGGTCSPLTFDSVARSPQSSGSARSPQTSDGSSSILLEQSLGLPVSPQNPRLQAPGLQGVPPPPTRSCLPPQGTPQGRREPAPVVQGRVVNELAGVEAVHRGEGGVGHEAALALREIEGLIVAAAVNYLRTYVSDLGDHRTLEQLRRILKLLTSVKLVSVLPPPDRDPTSLSLLPFGRLKVLELRGCDLSTTKPRGLLELRHTLEKLICHNSTVAFLSPMVDSEIAEAAARAAVKAVSEVDTASPSDMHESFAKMEGEVALENGHTIGKSFEAAATEARFQLKKDHEDLEQSVPEILEIQMNEIQDKIVRFEKMELLMEKEWSQLQHMKNLLFADQLSLLQQKVKHRSLEGVGEKIRTTSEGL